MNLLSLSNEVLLHIFSRNSISIPDLQSLMVSCRSLCNIIQESDKLWRLKYFERCWWGNLLTFQPPEMNEKVWFMRTSLRCRKIKEVRKVVQSLPSIAYPVGQSPLLVINKLIAGPYPIPEFVQKELEDIFEENIKENQTVAYYARDALVKVRFSILDNKWRDLVAQAQPISQMSLFEGVVLLNQWYTIRHGGKQVCVRDFETSFANITERVKQLIFEMDKVSNSADPEGRNGKILDIINNVMFDEMRFKMISLPNEIIFCYDCIEKVFEGRNGCALLLCAIYHEVARKMDILCEPVIGLQNTARNAGTNGHIIFLKWKDSTRADAEDIYIDVYRGRTFKHSSAYSIYPSLRELRTHSVDFILRFYLRAFSSNIMIHYTDMEFSVYETRSLCSMYPQDHNMISRYAERCIKLGIHLEDAIQLLQSPELEWYFEADDLGERCISKLNEQRALITAAKIAQHRLPSVKFSVGLVVNYSFLNRGENCTTPCVIVSWSEKRGEKFQESEELETQEHECVLIKPQTHYHVLTVVDHCEYQFNVPENSLEFLSAAVTIEHSKIGIHFESFDGRRYVPNAEKRAQFPEDEAFTISLIG